MAGKECKLMNVNYSKTRNKFLERLTNKNYTKQWEDIDWKKVKFEVNKLQYRIAKAMKNKNYNDVKRLQYLLTNSFNAKALAVKKVTLNEEKNISGVDKELWLTKKDKMNAILKLENKGYKFKQLRKKLIINYKNKNKKIIEIPTMYDRAMQELYILSLEPILEVIYSKNKINKNIKIINKKIYTILYNNSSLIWALNGKIEKNSNNVSYKWLIENIFMDKKILKEFLKAKIILKNNLFSNYDNKYYMITPMLVNIMLNGLEEEIEKISKNNIKVIRYKNEFIVLANNKENIIKSQKHINDFLNKRGLKLIKEKKYIKKINEGINFLDYNYKKNENKIKIKLSKNTIKYFVSELSYIILKIGKTWKQEILIKRLNYKINKWIKCYNRINSRKIYEYIDYILFNLLYKWAKRRHPNKSHKWIIEKYWKKSETSNWIFGTEKIELIKIAKIRNKKLN